MPQWRNSNQTRGMDEGALMKVGDLVRVIYDGSVGLVTHTVPDPIPEVARVNQWIWLHTGESFKADKVEVISESR